LVFLLLDFIKKYFLTLDPEIIVQAPARINLINPLDAVEGDFWMPSVAITGVEKPLSAFVYLKKISGESRFKIYKIENIDSELQINLQFQDLLVKEISEIKNNFDHEFKLVYASIYRLYKTSKHFWKRYINENFELGLLTTIPIQSGLGGSASIIIAVIFAFAKYFDLYNNLSYLEEEEFPINRDIMAEMATKVEDNDLKLTAGYADRYLISRGGLSFCSYYGKINHRGLSEEPLAVYDRIDKTYKIDKLPIIICFSGVYHRSEGVHQKLRSLYLKKEEKVLEGYHQLAEISWKSRFALMKKDWKLLGEYFKINTKIMNKIMEGAGFQYGIGLANNILIKLIEDHSQVYAAKLTGAGGGGCVFALVNPEKIEIVLEDWKYRLNKIITDEKLFKLKFPSYPSEIRKKLIKAEFYQIKINLNGVKELSLK